MIGVNNRDLATFETDLITTELLIKEFQKELEEHDVLLVSESGLFTRADLNRVKAAGAKAVLIGEALMRQRDITFGLRQLIGGVNKLI